MLPLLFHSVAGHGTKGNILTWKDANEADRVNQDVTVETGDNRRKILNINRDGNGVNLLVNSLIC